MKLAYEAYDRAGRRVEDAIDAANAAEATEILRRKGLYVAAVRASGPGNHGEATRRRPRLFGASRRLRNVSMFTRQLYVLVSSGTPLVEALSAIERQTRDQRWRHVVEQVRGRVEEGQSLAEALGAFPQHFDPVTRGLIGAGESAGKLPHMLDRAASLARKEQHVRSSVIGALVYPTLLVVVAVIVLTLLMIFVLPRFAELFETLDMPMPPTTAALMSISDVLRSYWWAAPLVLAAAGASAWFWLATPSGVRFAHTAMLRLPQFGRIVRSFATARMIRLMGILLDSYLPLLEVLQLVRGSVGNLHYRRLLERAEDAVTRGEPISAAFNDPRLISPSIYEAMRSGESSGQVGPLLLNLAGHMDEDNEIVVKSLTSIIEPVILLALGALVAFVAISMFMPLFDLTAMSSGGAG